MFQVFYYDMLYWNQMPHIIVQYGTQYLLGYLIGLNVVTFLVFGFDKWMATSKSWRISEKILWLLSLFGGSAGALMGMQFFRHKTRKISFQLMLVLILVSQVAVIFFYLYFFTDLLVGL